MDYLEHLLATPYSWLTLSGVFLGAGLSRMTTPIRRANERSRGMKWAAVYVSLALAIVSATLSVFVPEARLVRDVGLAYQFGGAALVSALALRFRLLAGSVVFLLLLFAAGVTVLARDVWTPVSPGQVVATVRVLAYSEDGTTLELTPGENHAAATDDATILSVPGARFSASAEVVDLSPHLFFVGMRYGLRFTRIAGESEAESAEDYAFADASGLAGELSSRVRAIEESLPGVALDDLEAPSVSSVVLRRYDIVFADPTRLEFREPR